MYTRYMIHVPIIEFYEVSKLQILHGALNALLLSDTTSKRGQTEYQLTDVSGEMPLYCGVYLKLQILYFMSCK